MRGLLEAVLLLLLVLVEGQRVDPRERDMDRGKETFLIRYKNGEDIVPVSVRLDYRKGTEYVLSLSPHSTERTVTFYDFNMRVIAFKHLATKNCFIMRMRHENIRKELRTLDSFKNEVISGTRPVVFHASRDSLHPSELASIAGAKVSRFCHRAKAYLINTPKNRKRPKRNADDYTQRTYGHFGQQSQSYSHYGQDTVSNGRGQPPSFPSFSPGGFSPFNPSDPRTGITGNNPDRSYSFQGNQRSGYEINQPFGPNGGLRSYGEFGAGFGQIPGFGGDPKQLAEQLAFQSGVQPFSSQEQVLRFPLPPSQNGDRLNLQNIGIPDQRVQGSRSQDPLNPNSIAESQRRDDSRVQDVRSHDPRRLDPRISDPRAQDPRSYDPRYQPTDVRLPRPPQAPSNMGDAMNPGFSYPGASSIHSRGAATDSESGAFAQGQTAPLIFKNMTFSGFDTAPALTSTGILSNTKVTVDLTGTNAVASSQGQLNDQRSQSQVQGTYAGAGSFSAQAQSGFLHGTTQSQVRGGSDGGSSISSANVERLGSAQSQVQVGTPDGKSSGSAQGNFVRGGTQAEAQGSRDSGTASSQSQSPGLSQSSATVNARGTGSPRERYLGEVSASSRGDPVSGASSTNLQGAYGSENAYSARAEGSFNSQSNYSPFSGLPSSVGFVDGDGSTSDSRRGDVLPEYRYPTRAPNEVRGNQTYPDYRYPATLPPDYRYPTTQSPYDPQSRDRVRPDPRYTTTPPSYDAQSRDRLPPDFRHTTTPSPYDQQGGDRLRPDFRQTTTTSPYDQQGGDRLRPDYRHTSTPSPYDQQGRDRPRPDYRYTTTTTTRTPYAYPTRDRGDTRTVPSQRAPDSRLPGQDVRRSGVSPNDGTYYYPAQTTHVSQAKGDRAQDPYEQRRHNIFPPYSPDPRLANKGPSGPPPSPYDQRRAYVVPSQTKSEGSYPPPRAYVFPDQSLQPATSQTKSQISYPTPPRAYVFPDPSQQDPSSQTKSQISYPTRPTRAYVFPDPGQQVQSQTKSQISYPTRPTRAYVFPDTNEQRPQSQTKSQISYPVPPQRAYVYPATSHESPPSKTSSPASNPRAHVSPQLPKQPNIPFPQGQVSCCRTRPEQREQCCERVPQAECCYVYQRDEQTRSRRYLNDRSREEDNKCHPVCYIVYKTIGKAKICQPSLEENC